MEFAPRLTAPDLARIGEALYGPRWQSEMARTLGVADRTVRRWCAAGAAVPHGVRADLIRLARDRRDALAGIIADLGG